MSPTTLFLAAFVMFSLGALALRKTSPYSQLGGTRIERRRTRKSMGMLLCLAALFLLSIAALSQFVSHR